MYLGTYLIEPLKRLLYLLTQYTLTVGLSFFDFELAMKLN